MIPGGTDDGDPRGTSRTLYLSIPVRLRAESFEIEKALADRDFEVLNPCRIVLPDTPKIEIPAIVARQCYAMIDWAAGVVLFADDYGRDCAAEVGYAFARGKRVYPLASGGAAGAFATDWMVWPICEQLAVSLTELIERIDRRAA